MPTAGTNSMHPANIGAHRSNERLNIQSKYRAEAQQSYASLMADTYMSMALTYVTSIQCV
jgi:hypothetical protein